MPIIAWCRLPLLRVVDQWLAIAAAAPSLVYYARLPWSFTLTMALFAAICLYSLTLIPSAGWIALGLLVITWTAQFIGHKIE